MPYADSGRNSTSTDHRLQIEKPMCSEKTEKNRLRRGTGRPAGAQKAGDSGGPSSAQRPGESGGGAAGAGVGGAGGGWAGRGPPGGGAGGPPPCAPGAT